MAKKSSRIKIELRCSISGIVQTQASRPTRLVGLIVMAECVQLIERKEDDEKTCRML
jgi:hypothetical protein